jgi:glutathione S-transferase
LKLYRCKTPTNALCPCGKVARALDEAGIEYETERVPLSRKAEKRRNVVEVSGQRFVPVVVDDAGNATPDAKAIIEMVESGSLGKAAVQSTS